MLFQSTSVQNLSLLTLKTKELGREMENTLSGATLAKKSLLLTGLSDLFSPEFDNSMIDLTTFR